MTVPARVQERIVEGLKKYPKILAASRDRDINECDTVVIVNDFLSEVLGFDKREVEVQMLYGMADAEKQALVDMGYRVRVYMPYGELIPGMAYLVRRLLENTSNDSFLRSASHEQVDEDRLLAAPGRPP